jgi:proton-dependent oligopeptide transporter, POT family
MSGATLEVEEAARGGLGGIVSSAPGGEKAAAAALSEAHVVPDSDGPVELLTGPKGEVYPTREELTTLRRVHGHTSWVLYTIGFVELCERFAYYGTTVLCEYLQCLQK